MRVIILPGKSKNANEAWIKQVAKEIEETGLFESTTLISYNHWDNPPTDGSKPQMDRQAEVDKLKTIIQSENRPYAIIAKSAGTGIAVETIANQNTRKPTYCVFSGLPITNKKTSKFGLIDHLPGYDIPTTIIQNPNERFIHPSQLEEHLKDINVTNTTIQLGKGNSHSYTVEEMVDTTIKEFNNYLKEK